MDNAHYLQTTKNPYSCWVYLLELESISYSIRYSLDSSRQLRDFPKNSRLIFYRGFRNVTDGIAYKVFLENLSPQSVYSIVSSMNPRLDNLYKEFLKQNNFQTLI